MPATYAGMATESSSTITSESATEYSIIHNHIRGAAGFLPWSHASQTRVLSRLCPICHKEECVCWQLPRLKQCSLGRHSTRLLA